MSLKRICLFNIESYDELKPFFAKVKEKTGSVSPEWFMSDLAPQFYDAFTYVNECSPKKLACTWHVDKAWQKEIHEKVKGSSIQRTSVKNIEIFRSPPSLFVRARHVFPRMSRAFLIALNDIHAILLWGNFLLKREGGARVRKCYFLFLVIFWNISRNLERSLSSTAIGNVVAVGAECIGNPMIKKWSKISKFCLKNFLH